MRAVFCVVLCVVLLATTCDAYWIEECGAFEEFMLSDNVDLDCAMRKLALDYSQKVLDGRGGEAVHAALNLQLCNISAPAAPPKLLPKSSFEHRVRVLAELGSGGRSAIEIFVSTGGSDEVGDGSKAKPFRSILRAQHSARTSTGTGVVVWLREGVYYQNDTLDFTVADSGASAAAPTVYASFPGERATVSGGAPLDASKLNWTDVNRQQLDGGQADGVTTEARIFKARLPPGFNGGRPFTGLFWNRTRLTRARYPNCADISGTDCYTLNASGQVMHIGTPSHSLADEDAPPAMNLDVRNQDGIDMFADKWSNARDLGYPHAASDGTLPPGRNLTLTVEHPDIAWRCHEECGWGAFSHWTGHVCGPKPRKGAGAEEGWDVFDPDSCRFDPTYNEPFWDQQVSGGFYYNATAAARPWAPAWTPRLWSAQSARGAIVHMYHSARWGGWQFALHSRNDTDQTLIFQCDLLDARTGKAKARGVGCPRTIDAATTAAVVQGGWQEGRGWDIGPRYTNKALNNSYFVENLLEELDYPGEWYLQHSSTGADHDSSDSDGDGDGNYLYIALPHGVNDPASLGTLVATAHKTVIRVAGGTQPHPHPHRVPRFQPAPDAAEAPVTHMRFENLTIAHTAYTFMDRYEIPSGGDWSVHRGGALFVDGATDFEVSGCLFDRVDGNGVFLSRYVRASRVLRNDFVGTGDSAILLVGASGRHRTNNAASRDYPAFNLVEANHARGVGVWGKQSAAYFKSVARENVVRNNVFHDGPSWDRQPFVYRANESDLTAAGSSPLRISPQPTQLHHNFVFNVNFRGPSCGSVTLDLDDESSQFNITGNVLVYGGIKNFDGMDRNNSGNLIIFPSVKGAGCYDTLQAGRNVSSAHSHFFDNHCVLADGHVPYHCGAGPAPFFNASYHIDVHSNTFSYPGATVEPSWAGICQCYPSSKTPVPCPFKTFADWQAHGHDAGSKLQIGGLSNAQIMAEARAMLSM